MWNARTLSAITTTVESGDLGIQAASSKGKRCSPLLYRCCQGVIIACETVSPGRLTIERLLSIFWADHLCQQGDQALVVAYKLRYNRLAAKSISAFLLLHELSRSLLIGAYLSEVASV